MGLGKKKKRDRWFSISLWYRNTNWAKVKFCPIFYKSIFNINMGVTVFFKLKITDNQVWPRKNTPTKKK